MTINEAWWKPEPAWPIPENKGRDVVLTMVAGRVVAERGHVTSVAESALLDEARELFAAKLPAIRAARESANRLFPAYQHIVRRAAATDVGFSRWVAS